MSYATVMQGLGTLGGLTTATDSSRSVPDRVMGAAGSLGTTATMIGGALTGATTAGVGQLGLGTLGTIIGGGGTVGLGTAGLAAGGVLSAAAGGYAAGTALDTLGGRALGGTQTVQDRGVGGGTHEVADTRRLSERMADATHTETGDRVARGIAPYLPTWLGGDGWW